jgi:transcriptional regulator with XRE-family HTH domain
MSERAKMRKNLCGRLVRRLRKRRQWTQEDLSGRLREIGWSKCRRSWLARIESGDVSVKDHQLAHFQAIFGAEFSSEFWALAVLHHERSSPHDAQREKKQAAL